MTTESSAQRVVEDLRVEFFRQRKSQEQIASAAGMSQSAVSRRLNGDVDSTVAELETLAGVAGLRLKLELVAPEPAPLSAALEAPTPHLDDATATASPAPHVAAPAPQAGAATPHQDPR